MGLVQSDVLTPSLMNGLFIIHVRVENLAEFMVAGRLEGYLNIIGSAIVAPPSPEVMSAYVYFFGSKQSYTRMSSNL